MSKCVRVLQVVAMMRRGGIENMLMNLYRNINRENVQFDFVAHRKQKADFDDEIRQMGGRIYYAPRYKIYNHFYYKKWWKNFLKQHPEYKIIHSHSYTLAAIHLAIAKKLKRTTIVHSHSTSEAKGIQGKVEKFVQRNIAEIPDYLFACSKEAGKWLYGSDCEKRENYILFNNAIDTEKYIFSEKIRDKIRNELGLQDSFVIGHIGTFSFPKNHSYLLDVFYEILRERPDSRLLLVGDGVLKKDITRKAQSLGIAEKVIMTGVRSDVNELLQAMDCFVFPSIYEGLPVTVVEAQASGLHCYISEEISDEVKITDLVKMLPIKVAPDVWAKKIIDANYTTERQNTKQKIVDAGYDIETTTKWLEDFYLSFSKYN